MSKKSTYEPHRLMPTKQSDSTERDYKRSQNREEIDAQIAEELYHELDEQRTDLNTERFLAECEAQEMYENGFHIEMPEN